MIKINYLIIIIKDIFLIILERKIRNKLRLVIESIGLSLLYSCSYLILYFFIILSFIDKKYIYIYIYIVFSRL